MRKGVFFFLSLYFFIKITHHPHSMTYSEDFRSNAVIHFILMALDRSQVASLIGVSATTVKRRTGKYHMVCRRSVRYFTNFQSFCKID